MREEVRHREGGEVGRQKDLIMNSVRKWLDQNITSQSRLLERLFKFKEIMFIL